MDHVVKHRPLLVLAMSFLFGPSFVNHIKFYSHATVLAHPYSKLLRRPKAQVATGGYSPVIQPQEKNNLW